MISLLLNVNINSNNYNIENNPILFPSDHNNIITHINNDGIHTLSEIPLLLQLLSFFVFLILAYVFISICIDYFSDSSISITGLYIYPIKSCVCYNNNNN